VFDVEVCQAAGLAQAFEGAFAAAKNKGMKVLVTVSHSAPYGCSDAKALMTAFFGSSNIDVLSPQLYTSGTEKQNDYTESGGVTWQDYKGAKAGVAPSIVTAGLYQSAQQFFQSNASVTLQGFVQWAQN